MGQNVWFLATGSFGVLAGTLGIAWGRLATKVDPVGPTCAGCDGWAGLPGAVLPWRVPVRCADCGRTVRWPTVALEATAALVVLVLARAGEPGAVLAARWWLATALVALVWADARHRVLPAPIVWAGGLGSVGLLALAGGGSLARALVVAVAAGGVVLALHLASPAGLGFGDVRLCVLLGLHLGWASGEAAAWALVLASAAGAGWGLLRPGGGRRATVPFGPFLAGAATVVLVATAGR